MVENWDLKHQKINKISFTCISKLQQSTHSHTNTHKHIQETKQTEIRHK